MSWSELGFCMFVFLFPCSFKEKEKAGEFRT